jgi:glutaminyl-peptide cyclotransferase
MLSVLLTVLFTLSLGWSQVEVYHLRYEQIINRSSAVFTQGLYFHEGQLFESSGKYSKSFIQKGTLDASQGFVKSTKLFFPKKYFAEGSCYCADKHWVLTWKSGFVFRYDDELTQLTPAFKIQSEGWGLACFQNNLLLSNGSSSLFILEPESGRILKKYEVEAGGIYLNGLNELEVVGDFALINRWYMNEILIFDLNKGQLVEIWQAEDFASAFQGEDARMMDSMNGIAWNSQAGELWATGKLWPGYLRIRVPPQSLLNQFLPE